MQDVTAKTAKKTGNQRKPDKSSDEHIALHLCYGQIGISAVAAAVRYQGGAKNPAYAPVAIKSDERGAAYLIGCDVSSRRLGVTKGGHRVPLFHFRRIGTMFKCSAASVETDPVGAIRVRSMSAVTLLWAIFPTPKSTADAGCSPASGTFSRRPARSSRCRARAGLEIAFAGRSNVGKSSLINALTGRRALARTSNTPGRTQELIFFGGPDRLVLVDLPGYGYAAAAKSKVAAWTRLIHDYLHGRATLARVYVLIDARHGLKAVDDSHSRHARPGRRQPRDRAHKMRPGERGGARRARRSGKGGVRNRPAAFPDLIATSARTGAGIAQLRAAIARLLADGPMQR